MDSMKTEFSIEFVLVVLSSHGPTTTSFVLACTCKERWKLVGNGRETTMAGRHVVFLSRLNCEPGLPIEKLSKGLEVRRT